MQPPEKACTKCGEVKPIDGFHRDKSKRGGRRSSCRECESKRKRRYYEENRDKELERKRRWCEENRDKRADYERRYREENRDKITEYKRIYHEENRDEILERSRRWREENRDEALERSRRWREENRDKVTEYKRIYHEENRDEILERSRRWYEENREYARARNLNNYRDYQRGSEAFRDTPKGSRWTPEEDAFLLADDGRTQYQKAIELGRTYRSVQDRLRRLRQTQTT